MSCSGYFLASSNSFSSVNLWSLCSFLVHILTILRDRENGIAFDVALGWHDDEANIVFYLSSFCKDQLLFFLLLCLLRCLEME